MGLAAGWPCRGQAPPLGARDHDDEVELSLITDSEQTPPLFASTHPPLLGGPLVPGRGDQGPGGTVGVSRATC